MSLPLFELLNPLDSLLRIRDHFAKQVRKARLAQLSSLGAVQRPMVDCLAITRQPQTRLLARGGIGLHARHGVVVLLCRWRGVECGEKLLGGMR